MKKVRGRKNAACFAASVGGSKACAAFFFGSVVPFPVEGTIPPSNNGPAQFLLSSRERKRREMHQSPARQTREKMMRLKTALCPPKSQDTISNRKSPMLPQLTAPMITRISAILSSIACPLSDRFRSEHNIHGLAVTAFARQTYFAQDTRNNPSHFVTVKQKCSVFIRTTVRVAARVTSGVRRPSAGYRAVGVS